MKLSEYLNESILSKNKDIYDKDIHDKELSYDDIHVGMKLKIREDLSSFPRDAVGDNLVGCLTIISPGMTRYLGEIVTVSYIEKSRKGKVFVTLKENSYIWPIEIFELPE